MVPKSSPNVTIGTTTHDLKSGGAVSMDAEDQVFTIHSAPGKASASRPPHQLHVCRLPRIASLSTSAASPTAFLAIILAWVGLIHDEYDTGIRL